MNENMVDSSRSGMTRTSSHLASIYGKDFLVLEWENGHQILAAGDNNNNNNRTRNTPFSIGYSVNPSLKNEDDLIMRTSKRAKFSKNSYKPNDEFPNLKDSKFITWGAQQPFTAAASNSHTQETKKPRIHSSLTPTRNSQKRNLGSSCDQRTRKVNFSNFSIPTVFLKSTSARINASSKKIEASTSNKEADDHHSAVIELTKGSHGFQEQISFTANKFKPESSLADKSVEPPCSEALREKGKADETSFCIERSSSSVCSLEASNNPNFRIRKHEDTDDDSAYLSDDDEETENLVRDSNKIKRSRNAESHSLSERKQRDKINEKILTLKDLIPNCNKVDKASMLDDAIDYLKTLKFQLEIMSMGRGLCMPLMMLQHQMNAGAQNFMGFRPGNGIPCTPPPPQFPIPPLSGITDNGLQMFGFSNQMIPPPMPIPNAPLFPMIGSSSTQPFNATNIATNFVSGQLTTPRIN